MQIYPIPCSILSSLFFVRLHFSIQVISFHTPIINLRVPHLHRRMKNISSSATQQKLHSYSTSDEKKYLVRLCVLSTIPRKFHRNESENILQSPSHQNTKMLILTIRKCSREERPHFYTCAQMANTSARFVIRNECQLYFNQTASPICESAGSGVASNFGRNGSSST